MNRHLGFLSIVASGSLLFTAAEAAAAPQVPQAEDPPAIAARAADAADRPWSVRAEGGLVNMRDNWLGLPALEVGLTVGRDLTRRVSVELTGNARGLDGDHRSWSALAVGRAVVAANATGHHAFTIAAGPFVEIGNPVHGTIPFAHAELAYVYRSSFGLTALAGAGPSVALASSSWVAPPNPCETGGDGNFFCIYLGPDGQELHAGDITAQARLAVGWQF